MLETVFTRLAQLWTNSQIIQSFPISKNKTAEKILRKLEPEIFRLNESYKSKNRLVLRKSGTEQKIRLMIESKDRNFTKKIILKTKSILKDFN